MNYTFKIDNTNSATATTTARASFKSTHAVCKKLNRTNYKKARAFLNDMINEKASIGGKYYTKSSKEILKLIKSAESNALSRNMDPENMTLFISAHQGPKMMRGRRKRNFGLRIKVCHIQAVLKGSTKKQEKKEEKK